MGRVPENPKTRPEGFLAARTRPEPEKTFANLKNPKITHFIYLTVVAALNLKVYFIQN